ncbi:MAG: hypothetical protein ACREKE_08535, partial [bacterium]
VSCIHMHISLSATREAVAVVVSEWLSVRPAGGVVEGRDSSPSRQLSMVTVLGAVKDGRLRLPLLRGAFGILDRPCAP